MVAASASEPEKLGITALSLLDGVMDPSYR